MPLFTSEYFNDTTTPRACKLDCNFDIPTDFVAVRCTVNFAEKSTDFWA